MLKIRQSCDRLIFNMGIPIPRKDGLYIEAGPRWYIAGGSQGSRSSSSWIYSPCFICTTCNWQSACRHACTVLPMCCVNVHQWLQKPKWISIVFLDLFNHSTMLYVFEAMNNSGWAAILFRLWEISYIESSVILSEAINVCYFDKMYVI